MRNQWIQWTSVRTWKREYFLSKCPKHFVLRCLLFVFFGFVFLRCVLEKKKKTKQTFFFSSEDSICCWIRFARVGVCAFVTKKQTIEKNSEFFIQSLYFFEVSLQISGGWFTYSGKRNTWQCEINRLRLTNKVRISCHTHFHSLYAHRLKWHHIGGCEFHNQFWDVVLRFLSGIFWFLKLEK